MSDVDWKRVVELADAGGIVPREAIDRASMSLDTWAPDSGGIPMASRELGLSEASLRLLADLARRLPADAPHDEVRRALGEALPGQPTVPGEPGTSPTVGGGPPPAALRLPTRLGPYQLGEEMGHGGMGRVFRARHETLGTPYAVKVLIAGEHASTTLIERFHREASLVARMGKHPNIVSVHHLAQEGPLFYFAMDLVEGRTLGEQVRGRRMPPEEAARMLEKVARAVAFAHDHGVIHRDLKPDNIMVDRDGEPQVFDFGLARDVTTASSLTEQGHVVGTPNYMAPEQVRGDTSRIDARTDVHALGAILYELLTGELAHPGRQIAAVFEHIIAREVVPPRRVRPELPTDLETVCLRCLHSDPADRYPTARDLADELARFLRGEPVLARPVTRLERAWRRVRRRPGVALLVVALAATGAIAFGSAWTGWRDRRAAAEERSRLVEGYVREVARSGHALVEAALARRSVADVKGSAAFAEELEAPVAELIRLAPNLAEPWYYRGRMQRALGQDDEAERSQTEAIRRAEAAGATAGSRALLPLACYERGVVRAFRYVGELETRRRELLVSRATSARLLDPALPVPTLAELEASFPRIPAMRREAADDLRRALAGETGPRALVARGILASLDGTASKEVRADLEHAIESDPYLTEAYLALAEAPGTRDDPAASLAWYRRGHQADRGYVPFVESLCARASEVAVATMAKGEDGRPVLDEAIAAAEETLARLPREVGLWSTVALILLARADADSDAEAGLALLGRAETAAGRAIEVDARHGPALLARGRIRLFRGKVLRGLGRDGAPDMEAAQRDILLAREIDPKDAAVSWLLATVYALLGQAKAAAGEDPTDQFARSLDVLTVGGKTDPRSRDTLSLASIVHLERAAWEAHVGADPAEDLARGVALAEKELAVAPESTAASDDVATAHFRAAELTRARGGDPKEHYARAREAWRALVARNPRSAEGWTGLGGLDHDEGLWTAMRGASPMDLFAQAIEAYGHAVEVAPNRAAALHSRAMVRLDAGRCALAMGEDPTPWFHEADRDIAEAIRARADSVEYVTFAIELAWAEGEAKLKRGDDPSAEYTRVEEMCAKALAGHAGEADLWTLRGLALRDVATWDEARGKGAGGAIDAAAKAFLRAAELEPGSAHLQSLAAEAVWRRAEKREAEGKDATDDYRSVVSLSAGILAIDAKRWQEAWRRGRALGRLGRYEEAIEVLKSIHAPEEVAAQVSAEARAWGEVAKAREAAGRSADEAFHRLGAACEFGWDGVARLERDPAFAALLGDPRWKELKGRRRR